MTLLVRNVFEQMCPLVEGDVGLAKRVIAYALAWSSKNDEHIKFFGGHLTGVQIVRFTDSDRLVWFEEILNCDERRLQDALYALPTVHRDHQVASDAMNLSCVWLTHVLVNADIPEKLKHDAMISVMLVLQYKFLTSRLYRHFKFPADKAVAEATYASLSMKFDLKQYGSWGAYLQGRAEDILDARAPRFQHFKKMHDDREIEKIINDIQTRLRKTLRLIAGVHYSVNASGRRISTTSQNVISHDGKEILKDKARSLTNYTRYVQSIIPDKSSFIREELLSVIENMIQTMPPHLFRGTLEWLSDQFQGPRAHELQSLTKEIMVHCFDYLASNTDSLQNSADLAGLLVRLRGVYTAARSTDPVLMDIRTRTEKLVRDATGTRNVSLLPPIRTGVLLYITLRALAKKHYADS